MISPYHLTAASRLVIAQKAALLRRRLIVLRMLRAAKGL